MALEQAEADAPTFNTNTGRDVRDGDNHAPRRPPLTDIARHAIQSHDAGGSPRRAIADAYGIPLHTADGWLRAAREHGALPEDIRDGGGRKPQRTKSIGPPRATMEES